MRGGRVVFKPIAEPNVTEWESALKAVTASLELEQTVHKSLLELHACADKHNDPQMTDFLEGEYLKELDAKGIQSRICIRCCSKTNQHESFSGQSKRSKGRLFQ